MEDPGEQNLCLSCGLCCNGVIFADVQLQAEDDPAHLRDLGIPFKASRGKSLKFRQPCPAHDGCRCRIYAERPKYCRQFECLLLKSFKAGKTAVSAARRKVKEAQEKAEKIKSLLRALGDFDETLALRLRFRRTVKRMERENPDSKCVELLGELTVAVHELNLVVAESFYSGHAISR